MSQLLTPTAPHIPCFRFRVAVMNGTEPAARLYLSFFDRKVSEVRYRAEFTLVDDLDQLSDLTLAIATQVSTNPVPDPGRFRILTMEHLGVQYRVSYGLIDP